MSLKFSFSFADHVPRDFHNLRSAVYDFNQGSDCWCHSDVRGAPCTYLAEHGSCHDCLLCSNFGDGGSYTANNKCWYFATYAAGQGFEITRGGFEDPLNNPKNPGVTRTKRVQEVKV